MIAKNYVDNLSEETKKGMLEKARQGIWPTKAPLGHLNVERNGRKIIDLDPLRAPIVRELFRVYSEGLTSIKGLVRVANELGLTTKGDRRIAKSHLATVL